MNREKQKEEQLRNSSVIMISYLLKGMDAEEKRQMLQVWEQHCMAITAEPLPPRWAMCLKGHHYLNKKSCAISNV